MIERKFRGGYRAKYYEIVDELSELIREFYGEKLVSLAIFGSVARDTFRPDSDIDMHIVVENAPKSRVERVIQFEEYVEEKLNQKFRELSSQGIYPVISPLIKTKDEVKLGSPILIEMTENVKIIHDKNDFLKNQLENLKRKLDEQGAKKIISKGGYYWLLKPESE